MNKEEIYKELKKKCLIVSNTEYEAGVLTTIQTFILCGSDKEKFLEELKDMLEDPTEVSDLSDYLNNLFLIYEDSALPDLDYVDKKVVRKEDITTLEVVSNDLFNDFRLYGPTPEEW